MRGGTGLSIGIRLLPVLFLIGVLAGESGCRKRDIRRVTIRVPAMTSAATAKTVEDALGRFRPAVQAIEPDIEKGQVVVVYDSMILARKNLEYAIARTGLDANDIQALSNAPPAAAPGM